MKYKMISVVVEGEHKLWKNYVHECRFVASVFVNINFITIISFVLFYFMFFYVKFNLLIAKLPKNKRTFYSLPYFKHTKR